MSDLTFDLERLGLHIQRSHLHHEGVVYTIEALGFDSDHPIGRKILDWWKGGAVFEGKGAKKKAEQTARQIIEGWNRRNQG